MISLWLASVTAFQCVVLQGGLYLSFISFCLNFPSAKVSTADLLQPQNRGFTLKALQLAGRQLEIHYFKF